MSKLTIGLTIFPNSNGLKPFILFPFSVFLQELYGDCFDDINSIHKLSHLMQWFVGYIRKESSGYNL